MKERRRLKLETVIHREISNIIQQELSDPRIESVTIIRVTLNSDLKQAKIFFNSYGPEEKIADAISGLEHARGFIRHILSRRLSIKFVPDLLFKRAKEEDYD